MDTEKPELISASWLEVARLILRSRGVRKGYWHVGVALKFAAHNVGPTPKDVLPVAIIGMDSVVLTRATEMGPLIIDASASAGEAEISAPARKRPEKTPIARAKPAKAI